MNKLDELLISYEQIKNQIYIQYEAIVNAILKNEITSKQEIEKTMDGLSDFEERRFLVLNQKLYRYVYEHYPQLVGNMEYMFRIIMETDLSSKDDYDPSENKGILAMKASTRIATESGFSDMTLDEINAEITEARRSTLT